MMEPDCNQESNGFRFCDLVKELGSKSMAVTLLSGFLTALGMQIRSIETALQLEDYQRIIREAESIRSGAVHVMADNIAGTAESIKAAAQESSRDEVENLVSFLRTDAHLMESFFTSF